MPETSKIKYMTVDEYLAFETESPVRHELFAGFLYPMEGPTEDHETIAANLFALLHNHLSGSRCKPFIGGMKVVIRVAECVYYPDVMVTCEPVEGKSVYKQSPCFVAEVLSPSTRNMDRREKFATYKKVTSMREILLINQDRYRIEIYRKESELVWRKTIVGLGDRFTLTSMPTPLEIPATVIYGGVTLTPVVEEEEAEYELFGGPVCVTTSDS